jgi:hypothetical protein
MSAAVLGLSRAPGRRLWLQRIAGHVGRSVSPHSMMSGPFIMRISIDPHLDMEKRCASDVRWF